MISRTRLGMTIRAGSSNREMVASLGIDVRLLYRAMFAAGVALAALAGMLAAPVSSVYPGMGGQDVGVLGPQPLAGFSLSGLGLAMGQVESEFQSIEFRSDGLGGNRAEYLDRDQGNRPGPGHHSAGGRHLERSARIRPR